MFFSRRFSPPPTPAVCLRREGGAGGEPHAQPLGPPFSCCSSQSARGAERRRVAAAGRKEGRQEGRSDRRASAATAAAAAAARRNLLRFLGSFRALAESALTGGRTRTMEPWKQCAHWLIQCRVLPVNHRVTWDEAQVFDLAQTLRDGVLLCQLLNNLRPHALNLKEINLRPQMSQVK